MNIAERFPGGVMAPINDGDITGGVSVPGPCGAVGELEGIIRKMVIPDQEAHKVSHAIPNPLADMTSFITAVEEVNKEIQKAGNRKAVIDNLGSRKREQYLEWLGLTAVIALRGVYSMRGLDIAMKKETLVSDNRLDYALMFALNNMGDEYRFLIDKRQGDIPVSGALFYFYQNDVPFAVYNHKIGICPMRHYPPDLFEGLVPWYECGESGNPYKDEHGGWKDPVECLSNNDYALKRLNIWMFQNGFGDYTDPDFVAPAELEDNFILAGWTNAENELGAFYHNYQEARSELDRAMRNSMSLRTDNFCKICWAYMDGQEGQPLPRLMTDQLVLAQCGHDECCGLGYDDATGIWQPLKLEYGDEASRKNLPEKEGFAPIIPFTEEAVRLYVNGKMKIRSLSFLVFSDCPGHISSIEMNVSLLLGDAGEAFAFSRSYSFDDIRGGKLPYLMVWPWIALPKGSWKAFYATQKDSSESYNGGSCDVEFGGKLTLELDAGEKLRVCECGADRSWEVYRNERRYRYAAVKRTTAAGTLPCGVVMVPCLKEKEENAVTFSYKVGIDFGTTSTVCAVQRAGAKEEFLPYRDFSRNVTVGASKGDIEEVARQRWLGRGGKETGDTLSRRKTLTVAQLFREEKGMPEIHTGNDELFVTGRFFLASSSMLCQYASNGNFKGRGIYNDLKLSDGTEVKEQRASVLFLAGVYTQALLYVLSENGEISELCVSYPGKLTRLNLEALWNGVAEVVNTRLLTEGAGRNYAIDTKKIRYFTEAEAARAYNFSKIKGVSYINIDIGGGTTDVSLANIKEENTDSVLSFKYAGRELIIDSFIECYRHWKGKRSDDMKEHFKEIWGNAKEGLPEEAKEQIINKYFEQCADIESNRVGLTNAIENESLRMFEEILLNDFIMDLPHKYDYNMLRSVIAVKFFLLMRMVAGFIRRNKAALEKESREIMTLDGKRKKEILLVFTGTASQTLQHIFGCGLKTIDGLSSLNAGNPKPEQEMLGYISRMVSEMADMKDIELKLQISADVQEKKEVAHGLMTIRESDKRLDKTKELTAEELTKLAMQLSEPVLREWFYGWAQTGLPRENFKEALLSHFEQQARAGNVAVRIADELQGMIRAEKVEKLLLDAQENTVKLREEIESLSVYWNAISRIAGLWPANAAVNADFGFGPGVHNLMDILPKGIPLQNLVSGCVNEIKGNQKKYRYLASLEDDEDRNAMFMVYIMDMVINEAMSGKQMEDEA